MSPNAYANQYRQTAVNSAVLDASPHRLIALMLGGVRERARLAIACMQRRDVARKVQAIDEACTIIDGLNGALDMQAGGDIAQNLSGIYEYAQQRLMLGNATNDPAPLHEVDVLLGEIETAWNAIDPGTIAAGAAA